MINKTGLLIGNSDGIGKATTLKLLEEGWSITGISRSDLSISHDNYNHHKADVTKVEYEDILRSIIEKDGSPMLCIYFAGAGDEIDLKRMDEELSVFETNLMGLIKTMAFVIPAMVANKSGHFIGLSSMADELRTVESPSYCASKAAVSSYLESMALAVRPLGVYVTNLRFGYVNTKMAKGSLKPFMMEADRAVEKVIKCMKKKPIRHSSPFAMMFLVKILRFLLQIKIGLKSL